MIKVQNLCKTYTVSKKAKNANLKDLLFPKKEKIQAVNQISFEIQKGEMVGFIGPNGAGKSTTIKMLTGILVPDAGELEILGLNPHKQRQRYVTQIGVVFGQKTQLWWDLPLTDTFELLRKVYNIPAATFIRNIELFNDLLGLADFNARPVRQLSLGQRMRGDIAAALLHDPQVIFFDEPTIGLDIVAKDRIRSFLRKINQETRVTMLFTTHDMQDIEKTCDRLIIIDKGSIIHDGDIEKLRATYFQDRVLIVDFANPPEKLNLAGTSITWDSPLRARITFGSNSMGVNELIREIGESNSIKDLKIEEAAIDDVVKKIYETGRTGRHA